VARPVSRSQLRTVVAETNDAKAFQFADDSLIVPTRNIVSGALIEVALDVE
jgi:hypothetical protein